MKKTAILATAIAAVLAAPLATAAKHEGKGPHVTVYGKAHVSVNSNNDSDGKTAGDQDNWSVNSNASRLGFKGSEDLGNGMTAKFQYEMAYDISDGGAIGGARNSWVGLAGGFGEVRVGRHDTPAKGAFYAAGNDRLGDSIIDLNTLYGFEETRASNVIAYVNKFGDISVMAAVIPGEGDGTVGKSGNGLSDGTSFAVMYKSGPIKFAIGMQDTADLTKNSGATAGPDGLDNTADDVAAKTAKTNQSTMNIGGSYAISDMINVGLQYQTQEDNNTDITVFALTGEVGFGDGLSVVLSFGNAEEDTGTTKTDGDASGIALKKKFSKRTTGYAAMASSDDPTSEGFAFGVVHDF